MQVVHHYTSRHWGRDEFKISCTKGWVSRTDSRVSTVHDHVTCHECLDILIPRLEKKLQTMKDNRAISRAHVIAEAARNPIKTEVT